MAKVDTTDLGTPKRIERVTATTTLNASGTTTVTLTNVPAGTKAVEIFGDVEVSSVTADRFIKIRENGSTDDRGGTHFYTAAQRHFFTCRVMLNSSYQFDFSTNTTLITGGLYITAVYL